MPGSLAGAKGLLFRGLWLLPERVPCMCPSAIGHDLGGRPEPVRHPVSWSGRQGRDTHSTSNPGKPRTGLGKEAPSLVPTVVRHPRPPPREPRGVSQPGFKFPSPLRSWRSGKLCLQTIERASGRHTDWMMHDPLPECISVPTVRNKPPGTPEPRG